MLVPKSILASIFSRATHLLVHRKLRDDEFAMKDRRMNANHDAAPHRIDQHGVFLVLDGKLDGAMTYSEPKTKGGRPGLTRGILVQPRADFDAGLQRYQIEAADRAAAYSRAIAHELLHTVGVDHHGAGAEHRKFYLRPPGHPLNRSAATIFTTGEGGAEHAVQINHEKTGQDMAEVFGRYRDALLKERPRMREIAIQTTMSVGNVSLADAESQADRYLPSFDEVTFIVGQAGDEHSGNDQCVMRYYMASVYEVRGHPNVYYYVPDGTEPAGLKLCTSKKGTGINGERLPQSRYGDAKVGDCEHRLCVSDAYPP